MAYQKEMLRAGRIEAQMARQKGVPWAGLREFVGEAEMSRQKGPLRIVQTVPGWEAEMAS